MRLGDKPLWQECMETVLEDIDMECFLEHVWPGEWQRYPDKESAFFAATEMMTPAEFKKALRESGCRND